MENEGVMHKRNFYIIIVPDVCCGNYCRNCGEQYIRRGGWYLKEKRYCYWSIDVTIIVALAVESIEDKFIAVLSFTVASAAIDDVAVTSIVKGEGDVVIDVIPSVNIVVVLTVAGSDEETTDSVRVAEGESNNVVALCTIVVSGDSNSVCVVVSSANESRVVVSPSLGSGGQEVGVDCTAQFNGFMLK